MTTGSERESARIYQFPKRGRFSESESRHDLIGIRDVALPRNCERGIGEAWYHQAAIQDAERPRRQ